MSATHQVVRVSTGEVIYLGPERTALLYAEDLGEEYRVEERENV